jgi:hypothetical protein
MGCARSRSLLDSCEHVIGVAASSPIMTGTGLYDSLLEGDGFELPVPVRQAKLTRSCR